MTVPRPTPQHRERRLLPPWWTVFFPLLVTIGVAGWRAGTAGGERLSAFVDGLVWPGLGAFLVVAVIVWLGWVLDID